MLIVYILIRTVIHRGLVYLVLGGLVLGAVLVGHVSAALPAGWSNRDIGTTGGSASETGGTWTVSGDGGDVWAVWDAFHYAYLPLSGDGQITARVVSNGSGSNGWSKGGVMIRETLSPNSKHAIMAITGGEGGGLAFQNRPTTGGNSYTAHGNPTAAPPYWVRLKRQGDTITGYSSADGTNWIQQPNGTGSDAATNPVNIRMASNVFIGLFVTSHAAGEVRTYTFDHVIAGSAMIASEPVPPDGASHEDTWVALKWTPGDTAVSHDVYFGDNYNHVNNGTGGTFLGNWSSNELLVGLRGHPYPAGLVPGTTYYWRIDEVEANGVTKHRGDVWSFFVLSGKAHNPDPADDAESVAVDATLTWSPGLGAETHTVYFGDDPEAVEDAVGGIPQTLRTYYPGELEFDKTYYWRVDEFDGAVTHRGDVWSFTAMSAEEFWAAAYYVDGGNRVANDGNPGTEARPFKTIGRGVQSLQPGDILLIKAGTYRETVVLSRSGIRAQPITIRAFPGDEGKVIINAAEPVTNWHKCTGPGDCAGNPYWSHIYWADVAALVQSHPDNGFAVRQVFQHSECLPRSRYPDIGWSYPTAVTDPKSTFSDSTLSKPAGYFNGAVCHIKTQMWRLDQIPIASSSGSTIVLAESPWYDISTWFGYYITSIVGEINAEGEWAYDAARKRLYLWPRGEVADDVEFTYRKNCLRTNDGVSYNIVRGLTMRYAYEHAVWVCRANNITLVNNAIEYAFRYGIELTSTWAPCNDNQILRNTIRYSGSRAINVSEAAARCNIEGNTVYATGVEHYGGDPMNGAGTGVYVVGPFARVYGNRIDRTGGVDLFLHAGALNREVCYNYITNSGLALSDTGALYMAGRTDGPDMDYIHHNIIEDTPGCQIMEKGHDVGAPVTPERYAGMGVGIYVDEEANNRIIEDNTVIRSSRWGIGLHVAPGNVMQRNTLYANGSQVGFQGDNKEHRMILDEVLLDNILFATDAQQKTLYFTMDYDNVHLGQSDRNYFYNPYNYTHIFVSRYLTPYGGEHHDYLDLSGWQAMSGYDANSKEFSYLDQFEDITIDPQKESRIVYNPSLDVVSIDLGTEKYCDVNGDKIYGNVSLQPFESKILIPCDF